MRRITKEISTLASALPCAFESVIGVRVDESRPDVIKALIIGPDDTPYANGCFIFDIYLDLEVCCFTGKSWGWLGLGSWVAWADEKWRVASGQDNMCGEILSFPAVS